MVITPSQQKAAGQIVDLVASRIGEGRAVHAETAISSAARLAGSLLLRSFKLPLEDITPGTVVLSDMANEKGPLLIETLGWFLATSGIQLDQAKLSAVDPRTREGSRLTLGQSLALLQERAVAVADEGQLDLEQASQAAALATGFIVKECATDLGAELGFNIAVYGFIEGSKTAPPPLTAPLPDGQQSGRT